MAIRPRTDYSMDHLSMQELLTKRKEQKQSNQKKKRQGIGGRRRREEVCVYGHAAVGAAEELDGRAGGARRDDAVLRELVGAEDLAGPPGSVAAAHPHERPDLRVPPRHAVGPLAVRRSRAAAPHPRRLLSSSTPNPTAHSVEHLAGVAGFLLPDPELGLGLGLDAAGDATIRAKPAELEASRQQQQQ
jgi:hypothetical protein